MLKSPLAPRGGDYESRVVARLIGGWNPAESFEGLKSHIDNEWIKSSLLKTGVATVRKRKLPEARTRPVQAVKM